jgi:acid phosphatase family membrane protein YuiD
MASRRTRSIGTKVTPEEYERVRARAGDQPISEWVRAALLTAAAEGVDADAVVLAELLALRTILLNLHFHIRRGATVTAETMQRLIERADQEKRQQAEARLTAPGWRNP